MTGAGTVDTTLWRLIGDGARRLSRAGVDTARLDAELLMAFVLGSRRERLYLEPDRTVGPDTVRAFNAGLAQRAARRPLAQITAEKEFWGLPFTVTPDTLVPRPDSETVVEVALGKAAPGRPQRLLDLGTGSGCLLLALLHELPQAWGVGVDASPAAAAVARRNARSLGLGERSAMVVGDWAAPLAAGAGFDGVVANPPYIRTDEIAGLAPEVSDWEPRAALDGGADGLDAYRAIAGLAPAVAAPGGWLVAEIGCDQADDVAAVLARHGYRRVNTHDDLAGRPRVVSAVMP